ncbi:MAG: hypothetical protein RR547_04175 [Raoultibacter sp.]
MGEHSIFDFETPCFVFDEAELRANFSDFRTALQTAWSPQSAVAYSVKTNPLPWILGIAKDEHCLAEVVSDAEYDWARSAGFSPEQIVFNGPIKSEQYVHDALAAGSIVNVDSERELAWLAQWAQTHTETAHVGIRVNFDLESWCPGQTVTGSAGGRFGFCYENGELARAIQILVSCAPAVRISGLHMHVTTQSRSLDVYEALAQMTVTVIEEFGLDPDYVDLGGGFFGGGPNNKGAYDGYAQTIAATLKKVCDPARVKLIVEPGGAIVCTPGRYLGRVIDVKDTTIDRFVVTELSRVNIDHEQKKTSYVHRVHLHDQAEVIDSAERQTIPRQVICGFTCMESDRLCVWEDELALQPGDMIELLNAGAYSMSFTPDFFIQHPPAVYAVSPQGEAVMVRKPYHIESRVQNDSLQ